MGKINQALDKYSKEFHQRKAQIEIAEEKEVSGQDPQKRKRSRKRMHWKRGNLADR